MNEADRNLLVEIRVYLPNGDFEVSTGYPVQHNLILTASHGLYPKDFPYEQCKIKFRWFHSSGDLRAFIDVQHSDIVWVSHEEGLDAALIRCTFPAGLNHWRYLSPVRPFHGERWASEGFPLGVVTEKKETVEFPFSGTLHSAASTSKRFHLELPENFKHPMDWGGVSGAPVFVRGQIVGIIVSTPTKAEGRLKAVFSAEMFNDPDFAEKIGYSQGAGRVAALQAAAADCLNKSDLACSCLGRTLGTAEKKADALAAKLIELPTAEAVIKAIKGAHKHASDHKESKDAAKAAATIRQLSLIAVPARFDTHIVETICKDMADHLSVPVLKLPICTRAGADFAMAAAEGQPAKLKDDEIVGDYPDPHGFYCIDHPDIPHSGIKEATDDSYFKDVWDRHMFNKFAPHLEHDDKTQLIQVVNRRLQVNVDEDQPRTHYVLLVDTGNDSENATWERRAGLVRADFPSLVFLRLDKHGDIVSETALLDPILKLLAKSKETAP